MRFCYISEDLAQGPEVRGLCHRDDDLMDFHGLQGSEVSRRFCDFINVHSLSSMFIEL